MKQPTEKLQELIDKISKNELMLPDFQRQFDWDIDTQKRLLASVLAKLPVGSILLLEGKSSDYKCKQIGLNPDIIIKGLIPENTSFLLDGQQRMTCLTNAFSDVIHFSSDEKVSNLASRTLLAVRYYLKVSKWGKDRMSDIFGVGKLEFPADINASDGPGFLTAEISDYIDARPFRATDYTDGAPFSPSKGYTDKLNDYCDCAQDDYYIIPLFLLLSSDSTDKRRKERRLKAIIVKIANGIAESIITYYDNSSNQTEKDDFAHTVIVDAGDQDEYNNASDKLNEFSRIVHEKAELWADSLKGYLERCVGELKLSIIEMPDSSRERAIDVYENMNLGGLSLSTLDLVAAKAAKGSTESLYSRIQSNLTNNSVYKNVPSEIAGELPSNYNASSYFKAVDGNKRIVKACTDAFLEVLGLYCNNYEYKANNVKCEYSKSKAILKLTDEQINNNCEKVCIGIDRAFAFLQMRCGVRAVSNVNYKIIIRLIAYIFTNEDWYDSEKVHKKIEAWYWASVFSGEFDKDQNERYEQNLRNILTSFNENETYDFTWLDPIKDNVLKTAYFSDMDFLLMEKANEGRIPKEHLGWFFCQFFLSNTHSDLIDDKTTLNVFTDDLEKHHIIPLGSVKDIAESTDKLRNDKQNIINSPLNFILITGTTNSKIGAMSLSDYEKHITPQAKAALCISNYPSETDLSNDDKVKDWMRERHKMLQGEIKNHIDGLLK